MPREIGGREFKPKTSTPKSESKGGKDPLAAFLLPFQKLTGQVVKGTTGIDLSPEAIAEQSLIEQAAGKTGDISGDLLGGFAKSMGFDPKLLLIGGAVVGIIVLVMVLKK